MTQKPLDWDWRRSPETPGHTGLLLDHEGTLAVYEDQRFLSDHPACIVTILVSNIPIDPIVRRDTDYRPWVGECLVDDKQNPTAWRGRACTFVDGSYQYIDIDTSNWRRETVEHNLSSSRPRNGRMHGWRWSTSGTPYNGAAWIRVDWYPCDDCHHRHAPSDEAGLVYCDQCFRCHTPDTKCKVV